MQNLSLYLRIDAHQHFWRYTPEEYGWIDESMQSIRRDYLPENLQLSTQQCDIDRVVSVQARQTLDETRWLLQLASMHEMIGGVVGWVPLVVPEIRDVLESLVRQGPLRAVRHVLQDEADSGYMLRSDFNRGISALLEFGLVYDILIFEHHLPQTIEFVDRHPQQMFVLDHIGKPHIRDGVISPWRENIRSLAQRPNVHCKISGIVTEGNHETWKKSELRPYWETVLAAFGPGRLMFGSDWPVCLVATTYQEWFDVVTEQISTLSESERGAILGDTARRIYRIDDPPKCS